MLFMQNMVIVKKKRWVPGRWENGHFVYDPDEKESGMMLKPRFIKGYKMLSRDF